MTKKRKIGLGVLSIIIIAFVWIFSGNSDEIADIEAKVKFGKFDVLITTTGELQAKNSEKIMGPTGLQRLRIYNVKITDLIPEGTQVKEGDYVATLDRSEVSGKLKDLETELQTIENDFEKATLDTTLQLRKARDELINLEYLLEEKKIVLEQSKFEPPATIRQNKINYEKSQRGYSQALKNYKLQKRQADAKLQEVTLKLNKKRRKRNDFLKIMKDFVIKAPKSGMLIYKKEWNGAKRKVGSTISPWEPTVATLPDLTKMISKTFVNEIDISKIKKGQIVDVKVDAFPEYSYSGEIITVANIGEQQPGSDAKVFEVIVQVNESDSILRPSMTTSNSIKTASADSVLFIPLEAIHSNDSLSYVFKKDGFSVVKQIVKTGISNENEIIVKKGLEKENVILLNSPENSDNIEYNGLDIWKKQQAEEIKKKNKTNLINS